MRVTLCLALETTGFDLGVTTPQEAKTALAAYLRSLADRVEATNPDVAEYNIIDDLTETRLGFWSLDIREDQTR